MLNDTLVTHSIAVEAALIHTNIVFDVFIMQLLQPYPAKNFVWLNSETGGVRGCTNFGAC